MQLNSQVRFDRQDHIERKAQRADRHQRRNRLEHIRMSEQEETNETGFDVMNTFEPLTDD